MNHIWATVAFGLIASLCWGSGDFSGGLASRRANSSRVVMGSYSVGFLLLVGLALLWREPLPTPGDALLGTLAGLAGVLGVLIFYRALANGKMGIVAPVSAVLTVLLPVLFSSITSGLPSVLQIVGIVLALLAIVFISRPERLHGPPQGLWPALLSGSAFGLFFILISQVHQGAVFWPLAVARLTSVVMLGVVLLLRRQPLLPGKHVAHLILLAGTLDALGNTFFVLAAHSGRLDIAAILSSLYPAATVILATLLLRERFTRIQGAGIALVLLAIPLISA